jgi:hypothetical protein
MYQTRGVPEAIEPESASPCVARDGDAVEVHHGILVILICASTSYPIFVWLLSAVAVIVSRM